MENNEMTEREMLEFAAKAYADDSVVKSLAGFERVVGYSEPMLCNVMTIWNPLTDDGDALQLAVKLGMDVSINEFFSSAVCVDIFGSVVYEEVEHIGNSSLESTRLAITKAAAEIGKRMA